MTLIEAQEYVRKRRQPPNDDADTDYDFVRLGERRSYLFAGLSLAGAFWFASSGLNDSSEIVSFVLFTITTTGSALDCKKWRQIRRLFEDRGPQSFEALTEVKSR